MYYWSVVILITFPLMGELLALESTESSEKRNYCGKALANALQTICGPGGYFLEPSTPEQMTGRATRIKGVVNECCLESCTTTQLRQYCDLYARNLEEIGPVSSTQKPARSRPTENRQGKAGKKRRSRCKKRCRCHKKKKQRKHKNSKKPSSASTTTKSVAHFEYFDDWRGPLFDLS